MSARRLVADVGGTNVRFAIADGRGGLDRIKIFRAADFPTFQDAFAAYRTDAGGLREIDAAAIAAAGPVDDGRVTLTNNSWVVDRAEMSTLIGGAPVALVNDLEAVAAALPHLGSADLTALGTPAPVRPEHRTMIAVNVGTGFGAASVIARDGRWYTCPTEAGHMTLGPVDAIPDLPADASVEDVLSGSGLAQLYDRLAGGGGTGQQTGPLQRPSDVLAASGRDAAAARAVAAFTAILGRVAGNLALATCAWGGVYLCGSVALAWSGIGDIRQFRAEFVRKGPMRARMQEVPTAAIRRDVAPLYGLAMMPISPR
jgi:glucokinase